LQKTAEDVEDPAEAELDLDIFAMVYNIFEIIIQLKISLNV